ncbi:hypothetical protein VCHC80A1_03147A, partial [Vibrio cholerae HC-80A1]
MSENQN